jgi:hypothetical protein
LVFLTGGFPTDSGTTADEGSRRIGRKKAQETQKREPKKQSTADGRRSTQMGKGEKGNF